MASPAPAPSPAPVPLTPLSSNAHQLPSSPAALSSAAMSPTGTPTSRLPMKTGIPPSASSHKSRRSIGSVGSSPFSTFSPAALKSNKGTPTKGEDKDDEEMWDGGDDTVSSTFSDVPMGQWATQAPSPGRKTENAATPRKLTPLKSPRSMQLPKSHSPKTPARVSDEAKTPRTIRPLSYQHPRSSAPVSPPGPKTPTNTETPYLLDFTAQFDRAGRAKTANVADETPRPGAHQRTASGSIAATPSASRQQLPPQTPTESRFFNLLDITPGPELTPGSVPSISQRELEDVKAAFQSKLSSLHAEISGKDAELGGLRSALSQAERRASDLSSELKKQQNRFEDERNGWQKVRTEMGTLFEEEKAEKETLHTIISQKDEALSALQQEMQTLRHDANMAHADFAEKETETSSLAAKLAEAETELTTARSEVIKAREAATAAVTDAPKEKGAQAEVERVAKELHSLYKAKHETKVAALKKSYETRWEKKVSALQAENSSLSTKLDELTSRAAEEFHEEEHSRPATSAGNASEEVERLKKELEEERREKGEIVVYVEELLKLQTGIGMPGADTVEEKRGDGVVIREKVMAIGKRKREEVGGGADDEERAGKRVSLSEEGGVV